MADNTKLHFGQFEIGLIVLAISLSVSLIIFEQNSDCSKVNEDRKNSCNLAKQNIQFFIIFIETLLMFPIIIQGLRFRLESLKEQTA